MTGTAARCVRRFRQVLLWPLRPTEEPVHWRIKLAAFFASGGASAPTTEGGALFYHRRSLLQPDPAMRIPIPSFAAATAAALALAALAGCGAMAGLGGPSAVAELQPTRGQSASGSVRFTQQADGVLVAARLSGLTPGQQHGFHIHEKGDCSSGDGTSAGGHFNPGGQPHGPQDAPHHAGDLPALRADSTGNVDASFSVKGLTIGAGPNDIVGKGLIVHTAPDDYTTQPTGNAGARIACAVIVKR